MENSHIHNLKSLVKARGSFPEYHDFLPLTCFQYPLPDRFPCHAESHHSCMHFQYPLSHHFLCHQSACAHSQARRRLSVSSITDHFPCKSTCQRGEFS